MNWLIVLCYCLVAYGACNVMVFGSGPFHIFEHIRGIANRISPHFGQLFNCMMCLPANFGLICSLVNWVFIPIAFTPFNIILGAETSLWWLAALCDGALTSGIVWLVQNWETYFENRGQIPEFSNNVVEDNVIEAEDITLKK